jgi:hypothetical protein
VCEAGPESGKTFACVPNWSFGEPCGLTIDAERQNRESGCVILDKQVALLLETYIPRKSPNLAIICHLAYLLEMALACKVSISAPNQLMLRQHPSNIICHIISHNNKTLK